MKPHNLPGVLQALKMVAGSKNLINTLMLQFQLLKKRRALGL